ncbi:hypothetical protein EP47_06315 [Legionella norrlandica]|uniref:Uncharacterized protein n=1 Tax=Legionella norrlandica TaxID=1498499 RepID=A0A0A2SRR4_9GAMM|nr:hypothetical protein [Legionella norrlandica]KGP62381.1 hypothetical protein EP47_06315 [Legionella norrlandica]
MVAKVNKASFIEEKHQPKLIDTPIKSEKSYAERIFDAVTSGRLNNNQMANLARKNHAKESLIQFINERPEDEKQKILKEVFEKNSNLNRFFSVQRGFFKTNTNSGSFKILNKMKQISIGSNVIPIKSIPLSEVRESSTNHSSLSIFAHPQPQSDNNQIPARRQWGNLSTRPTIIL